MNPFLVIIKLKGLTILVMLALVFLVIYKLRQKK